MMVDSLHIQIRRFYILILYSFQEDKAFIILRGNQLLFPTFLSLEMADFSKVMNKKTEFVNFLFQLTKITVSYC